MNFEQQLTEGYETFEPHRESVAEAARASRGFLDAAVRAFGVACLPEQSDFRAKGHRRAGSTKTDSWCGLCVILPTR